MSEQSALRVAMAQINPLVGDVDGNVGRILTAAAEARDELGAQVVVFPELAVTGYPPEDLLLRPGFLARVEVGMARLCAELRGIVAVVGYPARSATGLRNAAAVIVDGEIRARYDKQALPNYRVFDELRYFVAGDAPCVVEIHGVRCALTICEDVWLPGPVAQAAAAGAELVLNLNASPFHTGKISERETVVGARARENALPIVYVNQVGGQDELVFDGGSKVLNAEGRVVQRAAFFEERVLAVDFVRVDGALRPRPAAVEPEPTLEAGVYRALVLGVRDYIGKNGFHGAVVGLSGGIDSALTLAIAVDALGAERVEAVLMPSRYTAEISNLDAIAEAEVLGVRYHVLPIETAFQAFLETLQPLFAGMAPDTTEENIQARCRGVLLMALSNKGRKLVLTTGNKSETAVGYSTLYGDMAGGFAPIKDVLKTLVYRLCEYRNTLGEVIPRRVIERAPSAELRPEQTDQDSLPPYDQLDAILQAYVEEDLSVEEIVERGQPREVVERVARLVILNEYKRRQAAPGVRITPRAFGRDRRYPITSGFKR